MSNCVYVDDSECGPVCHTQKVVKARRDHRCCECRETIPKGSLYERFSGIWDGEARTYKTCARCVNVRDDYFRGWIFGELVDDFKAAHGFDYRGGIPADFAPCDKKSGAA